MSGSGDDYDEMIDGPGVRGEAGGRAVAGDDEVTRFLTELRALGDGPAPTPSPEVAALLGGATPILGRRTVVRIVVRTAAVAAVLLAVLVLAAANHSLPSPAQKVVSNVVNVLTPFHIADPGISPASVPPMPSDKPHPTPSSSSSSPSPSPRHSTSPTSRAPVTDDGGGQSDDRPGDDGSGGATRTGVEDSGPSDGADDRTGSRDREVGGSDDGVERSSAPSVSAPSASAPPTEGGDGAAEPDDH